MSHEPCLSSLTSSAPVEFLDRLADANERSPAPMPKTGALVECIPLSMATTFTRFNEQVRSDPPQAVGCATLRNGTWRQI
eukprot:5714267-Prymnesium_polylepis.2